MHEQRHPFHCHVLVCINHRDTGRKSCGEGDSPAIRLAIKEQVRARGLTKKEVRVSQTQCLGKCVDGPNVMIYPQDRWFSAVTMDDVPALVDTIERIVRE